jgi:hypothetical protein
MNPAESIEERIRQRAHRIWEDEGRPEGREHEHWERAAREIAAEEKAGENETPESSREADSKLPPLPTD